MDWEKKREEEKEQTEERGKVWDFRERSSTFSLKFSAIRPLDSLATRRRVVLLGEDNAWALVSGVFDKLHKGRGFILLVLHFI